MKQFKKTETGYHKYAVQQLAEWVNGVIENPFYLDGSILFVPDIVVKESGVLYEVVYSHPIDGKKLGLIQEWCYRNCTELTVFEVDAKFILSQTEKPDYISCLEVYNIEVL